MYQVLEYFGLNPWVVAAVAVWSLPWKGYALWKAARLRSKIWFVVLLLVNTLAILEILYIFVISRGQKSSEEKHVAEGEGSKEAEHNEASGLVTFEDFQKIHLRVAKILTADRVDGSDKLVRMQLDLGDSRRQVVAGIGKAYDPANIIGREIIIVANLQPRKLMGLESQGMLLAATSGELPVILMPEREVSPGSKVS